MSVVIILMLASLAVGLVFVAAFIWSVRSGQYEDTVTPSMRVLLDDTTPPVHSQANGAIATRTPAGDKSIGGPNKRNRECLSEIMAARPRGPGRRQEPVKHKQI